MYEDEFGLVDDPTARSTDELLRRAYALGVAASMGHRHPDELDRLRNGADGAYERNLVEVAHEEGKREARSVDDDTSAWSALVTDAADSTASSSDDDPRRHDAVEGPPAAVERVEAMEFPDRDPEMTDLPEFL